MLYLDKVRKLVDERKIKKTDLCSYVFGAGSKNSMRDFDRTRIDSDKLERLCEFLEVPFDYFLYEDIEIKSPNRRLYKSPREEELKSIIAAKDEIINSKNQQIEDLRKMLAFALNKNEDQNLIG